MKTESDWFRRIILPGLAFKAVVIGGGYATGRELVTFFLGSGPLGGLYGLVLAMLIWSCICAVTFSFAHQTNSYDYRSFFKKLLGPLWPLFEAAYFLALMVTLAVFAAAAGEIGSALFNWPTLLGALLLMGSITMFAMFGNDSVEHLFKYVSYFLYVTYAVFIVLSVSSFGHQIAMAFEGQPSTDGWALGGMTYAGYNVVGAVTILPIIRHMRSKKDAVQAGLIAGPLAMVPAILFFIAMVAFYPEIGNERLPSDFLLDRLNMPVFRYIFQAMIFAALLESGVGGVHAINERIAKSYHEKTTRDLSKFARLGITLTVLVLSIFVAGHFGLVALIAQGYSFLAYVFLAIFLAPLVTVGLWRVLHPEAD
ncbi:YkvI family membrane protein [Kordiimonas pumila]|uniref:Membrane protein YkvI n=1 Tax=Kordiimonas pumila TaxID=2161677 RepID=A0ABV7D562_9PROT|nr:hypothetical protein [Kordiimonas pumila]